MKAKFTLLFYCLTTSLTVNRIVNWLTELPSISTSVQGQFSQGLQFVPVRRGWNRKGIYWFFLVRIFTE